jgi:hypothetical protein
MEHKTFRDLLFEAGNNQALVPILNKFLSSSGLSEEVIFQIFRAVVDEFRPARLTPKVTFENLRIITDDTMGDVRYDETLGNLTKLIRCGLIFFSNKAKGRSINGISILAICPFIISNLIELRRYDKNVCSTSVQADLYKNNPAEWELIRPIVDRLDELFTEAKTAVP